MRIAHVFRQAYYSLLMAPIMYFIEDRSLLTQEWHKWKIALKEVLYWGFGISYNSEEKILFLVGIFSFEQLVWLVSTADQSKSESNFFFKSDSMYVQTVEKAFEKPSWDLWRASIKKRKQAQDENSRA